MGTQFPKEIELSQAYIFFDDSAEHVPPPTHDPVVAEQRHKSPSHTQLYKNQLLGAITAQILFPQLVSDVIPELDKRVGTDFIAGAAFGSGRLSFEQAPMRDPRRRPMRRNIALPDITHSDDPSFRRSYRNRIAVTYSMIDEMVDACMGAYVVTRKRPITKKASEYVGRTAAGAALWMTLMPHPYIEIGDPADVQFDVRAVAMKSLKTTEQIGLKLREHVSLAMLATPDSPLTAQLNKMKAHTAFGLLKDAQAAAPAIAAQLLAQNNLKLEP